MIPEKAAEYVKVAEQWLDAMEVLHHFGFKPANPVCFYARQYTEMMIKAKLIEMGIVPPHTHDLCALLDYFDDSELIQRAYEHCLILSQYKDAISCSCRGFVYYSQEEAEEAYNLTLEIPRLIGVYDPKETE